MSYGYCKMEGTTCSIEADECLCCEYGECEYHPDKTAEKSNAMLEKFRSSELAQDITKRLSVVFAMPEDRVANKLDAAFNALQSAHDKMLHLLVADAVRVYVVNKFDAKAQEMVQQEWENAMAERLLMIDKDGSPLRQTIQQHAVNKIKGVLAKQANPRSNSFNDRDTIDQAVERLVGVKVNEAVKELVAETVEKFNQEAMKKMMAGMAKAIADDKRLLAVVGS